MKARTASQAGGLAVGVHAALQATGGLWFGWSGELSEEPGQAKVTKQGNVSYALCDIAPDLFESYYGGFSNRTLWPLFHYRIDLASFEHEWYASYRRVNAQLAARLKPLLTDDDIIWVHDYHLIPMASELRRLGVGCPIGFFLHIPFPAPEIYVTMPWHRQLAADLCAFDVVGFQTAVDVRQLKLYLENELGGTLDRDGTAKVGSRHFKVDAYPIGIDVDQFKMLASSLEAKRSAARVKATLPAGRKLMIGVDRLDYTKGITERLQAYQMMLETYDRERGAVVLMQISAPSRVDLPEYLDMTEQVEKMSGHINGRYSEADWIPLRYINRSFSRRQLGGFFKMSQVCLVTPLRDGMNLVAEEYVAAQDPDDPGVLVLSRFAGCANILHDGALIVNPYDVHHSAETLYAALEMPLDERQDRWRRMLRAVQEHDINVWRDRFLSDLRRHKAADAA